MKCNLGAAGVPIGSTLIGVSNAQYFWFSEGLTNQLQADRQTIVKTTGNRDARQTSEAHWQRTQIYDFNDGSVLWLAELLYHQPNGAYIENIGVIPDIPITDAWDDMHPANDMFIKAAQRALHK